MSATPILGVSTLGVLGIQSFYQGAGGIVGGGLVGKLADMCIWPRILTTEEIVWLANPRNNILALSARRLAPRAIMSRQIYRNTTDNRARIRIYDDEGLPWSGLAHDAPGLQIWYTPLGGSPVQITLSSGNWTERKHGWYEVAVPDSAYTGTAPLQFSGEIEGGTVEGPEHIIVGYDPLAPAVGAATAEQAGEIIERLTPGESTEVDKVA